MTNGEISLGVGIIHFFLAAAVGYFVLSREKADRTFLGLISRLVTQLIVYLILGLPAFALLGTPHYWPAAIVGGMLGIVAAFGCYFLVRRSRSNNGMYYPTEEQ